MRCRGETGKCQKKSMQNIFGSCSLSACVSLIYRRPSHGQALKFLRAANNWPSFMKNIMAGSTPARALIIMAIARVVL